MTPDRAAAIADLEMVVENLDGLLQGLLKECQEHGAKFTPKQEGKFEGGFLALRGVLVDELRPMLDAWKAGGAFSRKGEEILAAEHVDGTEAAGIADALRTHPHLAMRSGDDG